MINLDYYFETFQKNLFFSKGKVSKTINVFILLF